MFLTIKVADFKKQHQVAMNLYKLYPKIPYFSWAIMSLYVKAECDRDPSSVRVSLPLAERMMAKFIEDNKIETEHEIWLYALILQKQVRSNKPISFKSLHALI
jgi:N-terminal acetyltransferase B complex non-catalytic subunit